MGSNIAKYFSVCCRSKKNRQLNDPRLTAAAEAAVAEAEAEEALAAALEARLNHGRRSLCPEVRTNFRLELENKIVLQFIIVIYYFFLVVPCMLEEGFFRIVFNIF